MTAASAELSVAEAREVLSRGSKSFGFAAVFLPAACRDDAAKVYAFCRSVDDFADERTDDESARAQLAVIEEELRGERPARPEVAAYREVSSRRGFGLGPALDLLEGVRSDIGEVSVRDDAELLRYCYRVAGTVGLMMSGVLGVRDQKAAPFAIDLGIAMQLTNICRDVLEDAKRGRVYLPAERMRAGPGVAKKISEGTADVETIIRVTRELLALAELHYQNADLGLHFIPRRPRFAILLAARLYRAIGRKLLARGGNPLLGRTVVSWPEKLWVLMSALAPSKGGARG